MENLFNNQELRFSDGDHSLILSDQDFASQFRGENVEADSNFHTMRSPTWTLQCLLLHVPNLNCLQLIHAI